MTWAYRAPSPQSRGLRTDPTTVNTMVKCSELARACAGDGDTPWPINLLSSLTSCLAPCGAAIFARLNMGLVHNDGKRFADAY